MNILTVIYLIVAFILGGCVAIVFKKKNNVDSEKATTETDNSSEKEQESKIYELEAKYKSLLQEANSQVEELDKKLQNALDGKIDDSIKEQLAEAEKLKKKIRELEDELEEAEDDLSDVKKKLKSKEEDIADLQDSLGKEQKVSKELSAELSSVKSTLEEKVEELKLKVGSLDFIQEVLSAPEKELGDVKQLEQNISDMKSFALGQLMDCFATLKDNHISFNNDNFDEYRRYWKQRFYEWASVTKKGWINGKTTIAFVGEFSAGKTSIVNRILSQDDPSVPKLPVSTKATTAIATYIAGGPAASYQFVTPEGKMKFISQKTFTEKVSKEVLDQIKGVSSLIQYFVMTYNNPNLNGLSILDTPGFNSNDKNDAERTMDVINECDALFWVFDVNAGTVNRSSISVIKQYLNKPLYVVINKVDTKSASEVQKVEDLIKRTLNDEGLKVERYIRFSSKSSLSDIMTPIKSVKHLTEKELYLQDLEDAIQGVMEILESNVNNKRVRYKEMENQFNRVNDIYINHMRTLYNHCMTAENIPHRESHWFSSDNYEMSINEYNRLCNVLGQVVSDAECMGGTYDDMTNTAMALQEAYSDKSDAESAWRRVNDIKTQFSRLKNKF